MLLSLVLFTQLAANCAPSVHVHTLAAIARTESGFHTSAIHDNTDQRRYLPRTQEEAIALATELVTVQRHSVDLGLMQINSSNLARLGITLAQAFEPCQSLQAGARVLQAGFAPPAAGQDTQPALQQALSRYNTGDAVRGFQNGYVAKVMASAEQVVPAIRLGTQQATGQEEMKNEPTPLPIPEPPPAWDVFGRARYDRDVRDQAGSRLSTPAPLPATPKHPVQRQPVQLQATRLEASDVR